MALALVVAGCGNSSSDSAGPTSSTSGSVVTAPVADLSTHHPVQETGVTDTTIRLGSVASITNPTAMAAASFNRGLEAFFTSVNRDGGIWGRNLELVSKRDDLLGNNLTEVEGLLSQDNVFAAFIAAVLFTGHEQLAKEGIPTFGWNIEQEWAGPQNFFPSLGALCFHCVSRQIAFLAQHLHAHTLGVLAYDVPQSKVCADGMEMAVTKYGKRVGLKMGFIDRSLTFGQTDLSVQVDGLKKAKVDLVATCMDRNAVFTVKQEMNRQGFDAPFLHPQLYDAAFVEKYPDDFEGDFIVPQFTALENKPRLPAIQAMFDEAKRDDQYVDELFVEGWVSAKQFYDALKATGPDFTRAKLVDAWNHQPKPYTADGFLQPISWPKQHDSLEQVPSAAPELQCTNYVTVHDGKFVPTLGEPGKPWVCFSGTDENDLTPEYHSFR